MQKKQLALHGTLLLAPPCFRQNPALEPSSGLACLKGQITLLLLRQVDHPTFKTQPHCCQLLASRSSKSLSQHWLRLKDDFWINELACSQDNAAWPVTTATYFVFSENTEMFTEDKMNAFAVTLFCRPDYIPSFANSRKRNKKCLWLRRGRNYFLRETSREEGTELWCDTGISQCGSQTDSGKEYTFRMSMSCFKKAA